MMSDDLEGRWRELDSRWSTVSAEYERLRRARVDLLAEMRASMTLGQIRAVTGLDRSQVHRMTRRPQSENESQ